MSHNTISILGCGWLGKPLAVHLMSLGYAVKGSTRSTDKLNLFANLGIRPFIIDIGNLPVDIQVFLESEILIVSTTSKNLVYYQKLLNEIEKSQVKKVIFISSTSVYKADNKVVTENTFIEPGFNPLQEIEVLFKTCRTIKTTIIRFAGLFGYDRKPGLFFATGKTISDPEGLVNLIHQDDCIHVLENIIKQDVWGETFNSCADSHPTKREFYTKAALDIGISPPEFKGGKNVAYKIVSSKKVKEQLQVEFKHNDLMNIKEIR